MTTGVRWGFLGAGSIARGALAPAVHAADGAVLQAAAARDPERARALGPCGAVYSGYRTLLADDAVEAVYVALDNAAHRPWVLAALAAGKHVLCEKPMGLSAAEVREMAAAAVDADRLLVEASWWRWGGRCQLLERLLAAGAVGEVRHVAAGFTFPGVAAENYRMDPARGGGALYDVGHYAASAVAVAYERATPEAVRARCRRSAGGVDLDAEVVTDWPGRRTAEIRAGMDAPYAAWLRISGAEGELELPSHAYAPVPGAPTDVLLSDARGTYALRTKPEPTYQRMVEAVSARIRGDDTAWVVPPADTLATAVLLDLARADCSP